jgi:hypothetical protein
MFFPKCAPDGILGVAGTLVSVDSLLTGTLNESGLTESVVSFLSILGG